MTVGGFLAFMLTHLVWIRQATALAMNVIFSPYYRTIKLGVRDGCVTHVSRYKRSQQSMLLKVTHKCDSKRPKYSHDSEDKTLDFPSITN